MAKKKEIRDMPMSFRIKPSLKAALEAAAEKEQRSVSQLVAMRLEAVMRAEGFLK
jgi:predicted HicB family RNase H-like nuclease